MNASRLSTLIDFLLKSESKWNFQSLLQSVSNSLQNLTNAPNNAQHQNETASTLNTLNAALNDFASTLTPAQKKNLSEVKAYPYFSSSIIDEIQHSISQNPTTPSVTNELVKTLVSKRQSYISVLQALKQNMPAVGVESNQLKPDEAEAGILLPRDLFNNDLDEFQKELRVLNQILRIFYEVSNVPLQKIELRQISTSDPIIFLGIDITVLVHFGHALKWCVDTIKSINELKKFIDMAKGLDIDPAKTAIFDKEIEERVRKRVDEKTVDILQAYSGNAARKAELSNSLHLALGQLLERVERGMTVEIRLIPPQKSDQPTDGPTEREKAFSDLTAIANQLEFPQIQGQPALKLSSEGSAGQAQ